jgi:glyoxylase-like metal-dependent hydrolase (beta-lactamase superfamily II)
MMWTRSLVMAACIGAAPAGAATMIAPDTYLVAGAVTPGVQPDGNTVLIETTQGLIVFDTGRHAAHTQQILDFAGAAALPVKAIVNSHWHLDHIGGNVMLRQAYPDLRIYASDALAGALGGFLAHYRAQLVDAVAHSDDAKARASMQAEIALIDAGPALAPTDVVGTSGRRTIAGRDLELHLEHAAVTAGDLWVYDPTTRVLLAGDLVTLPAPFLDTACPQHWQASLRRLGRQRFRLLVPGHGAPMERAAFDRYRTAFDRLLACAGGTQPKEACIDGWIRDADTLLPAAERDYARALLDYYMDQVLRGHPEQVAKLCRA